MTTRPTQPDNSPHPRGAQHTPTGEPKKAKVIRKRGGAFDVVAVGDGSLITGGYGSENDAMRAAIRIGRDVEGAPAWMLWAYRHGFAGTDSSTQAAYEDAALSAYEANQARIAELLGVLEKTLHPLAMAARLNEGECGDKCLAAYNEARAALQPSP